MCTTFLFLLLETLDLRAHFTDWIQRYKIVYAVQLDPESLQSSFAIIPLGLGQARALRSTALYSCVLEIYDDQCIKLGN